MTNNLTRRSFIASGAAAAAGTLLQPGSLRGQEKPPAGAKAGTGGPKVIASANGARAVELAMKMLGEGADPLDAAIAGVNLVEDDPNDQSVGLGGLPNEDGVVELDASVMHGPTHMAGAVAALRNIRNPSSVARLVMQRTNHVLLVGEGALRFAKAHGFKEEDLLTDRARETWLDWKERHSDRDDWLPPAEPPARPSRGGDSSEPTWGTISCLALTPSGDLAGVTTTSGLSFKIAGRVGDSPIIGAGLYVDNEVGAAGSTGRGEANLQNCSSFAIVEFMRRGMTPEEACVEQMRRVAAHTEKHWRDEQGLPRYDLRFYALRKDGLYGGAAMRGVGRFVAHDGREVKWPELQVLYR
jgi:N4-(beta-N-acetylglucosaminyl)-L-asparaginase